jgi:hypothetical protein
VIDREKHASLVLALRESLTLQAGADGLGQRDQESKQSRQLGDPPTKPKDFGSELADFVIQLVQRDHASRRSPKPIIESRPRDGEAGDRRDVLGTPELLAEVVGSRPRESRNPRGCWGAGHSGREVLEVVRGGSADCARVALSIVPEGVDADPEPIHRP